MPPYLAEFTGTLILILLGDGAVATVLLKKSKGEGSGWIVITTGWGLAVAIAVYSVGRISGAHINPAVTIGLVSIGAFPWNQVAGYVAAQVAGAMTGAILVWLGLPSPLERNRWGGCEIKRILHRARHPQLSMQFNYRDYWNGHAGVWRSGHCRQCAGIGQTRRSRSVSSFQLGAATPTGRASCLGNWNLLGRAHWLRYKPGQGHRPANRPRHFAHTRKGKFRLEI